MMRMAAWLFTMQTIASDNLLASDNTAQGETGMVCIRQHRSG
jgi:hypothetical protein